MTTSTTEIVNNIVAALGKMQERNNSNKEFVNTVYKIVTTEIDGLMSSADKIKLDNIEDNANCYKLPIASNTTLGGVKSGSTVTSTTGLTPCPIIKGVPLYKNYTLPIASNDEFGGVKSGSTVTSTTGLTPCPIIKGVPYYDKRSYNDVTNNSSGLMSSADKIKLDNIEDNANCYKLPIASNTTFGGVKSGSTVTSTTGLTPVPIISGIPYYKDTIYEHPTNSGNKHIPTGGSSGQILGWSSSGTAKWITPSFSGNYLSLNGGTIDGELSITSENGIRLVRGSYGLILKNDGKTFNILTTFANNQYGENNSFRPLSIDISTGICNINGNAATATNAEKCNMADNANNATYSENSKNSDTVNNYHITTGTGNLNGPVGTIYIQYK